MELCALANLMEFGQMCCIQRFISENPIDAEHFCRLKSLEEKEITLP